jgi:hypothetical protein
MYSVSNGDTLRLDSREFTAIGPSGETIAAARAAPWLNPLVQGWDPELGDLPVELRGDGNVRGWDRYPEQKKTFYRVVLTDLFIAGMSSASWWPLSLHYLADTHR